MAPVVVTDRAPLFVEIVARVAGVDPVRSTVAALIVSEDPPAIDALLTPTAVRETFPLMLATNAPPADIFAWDGAGMKPGEPPVRERFLADIVRLPPGMISALPSSPVLPKRIRSKPEVIETFPLVFMRANAPSTTFPF